MQYDKFGRKLRHNFRPYASVHFSVWTNAVMQNTLWTKCRRIAGLLYSKNYKDSKILQVSIVFVETFRLHCEGEVQSLRLLCKQYKTSKNII